MSLEYGTLLSLLCLAAGYAFGNFLAAEVVARCLAGTGIRDIGNGRASMDNIKKNFGKNAMIAVAAGDILTTVLACWFCYRLAAPELEHTAILYGGIGVIAGHTWPVWLRHGGGRATVMVCTWLILYLPVTGLLCCLAGAVVTAGIGATWGCLLIPCLAAPVAWLQFGMQSGLAVFAAAILLFWQYRNDKACRKNP